MRSLLRIVFTLASLVALQLGGMDMAEAQNWAAAKVVKYRVEGVHKGRAGVVFGDYDGKADVLDRITIEFTWDAKKRSIVEPVTIKDGKSEVSNLKSDGTNCGPPQLKGEYEHFQTVSHSMSSRDQIQIKGTRTYPPASVSNYPASCSMRAIPGRKEDAILWVAGAGPEILSMPGMAKMPNSPISVSADGKSFSIKGAENWVWTYTPTFVQ